MGLKHCICLIMFETFVVVEAHSQGWQFVLLPLRSGARRLYGA